MHRAVVTGDHHVLTFQDSGTVIQEIVIGIPLLPQIGKRCQDLKSGSGRIQPLAGPVQQSAGGTVSYHILPGPGNAARIEIRL